MSTPVYDGRYSEQCVKECAEGVCVRTIADPYGCGSCCGCLGGCRLGFEEQVAEFKTTPDVGVGSDRDEGDQHG